MEKGVLLIVSGMPQDTGTCFAASLCGIVLVAWLATAGGSTSVVGSRVLPAVVHVLMGVMDVEGQHCIATRDGVLTAGVPATVGCAAVDAAESPAAAVDSAPVADVPATGVAATDDPVTPPTAATAALSCAPAPAALCMAAANAADRAATRAGETMGLLLNGESWLIFRLTILPPCTCTSSQGLVSTLRAEGRLAGSLVSRHLTSDLASEEMDCQMGAGNDTSSCTILCSTVDSSSDQKGGVPDSST